MSHAIAAEKRGAPAAKRKPAAKPAARQPTAESREIDRLLERVRLRGEALSAQIKDLLERIG